MIDPNTSSTVLTAMETYAQLVEPEYDIPPGGPPPMESPEWQNGVIPLDTLPAAWWNWMWKMVTEQEKRMVRYFNSIMTEFGNLLTAGGVASFDETVTNQLVLAIQAIARTPATTLICGAIKAGTAYGTLAVDGTTGVATMNGAGTGQFNTIATDITGAINELDGDIGQEINDRTSADNTLQGAINGKAPINHASSSTDPDTGLAVYGQASATDFGHVKLTDAYTDGASGASSGVAASAKALKDGLDSVIAGQASVLIGSLTLYAGDITNGAPQGYLPCDGRAVDRATYASLFAAIGTTWGQGDGSTTFNIPDLREVVPVGVGTSTRSEGTHEAYTLGQFKDDQFQDHGHSASTSTSLRLSGSSSSGGYIQTYASGYNWGWQSGYASSSTYVGNPNSGRHGTTTRMKSIGVNYLIYTGV